MKRILGILVSLSLMLFIGGCWDRVEINDLAIVTAASIDKAEGGQIELSLQIFIPSAQGGSGEGSGNQGKQLTLVRTATGMNLAEVIYKIQRKLSRKIFLGHCKVYIFGEALAQNGIEQHVDFLARHPEPRNRAYLFVSKGKGTDLLKLFPALERYSGETMRELSDLNIGMRITFTELRSMLKSDSKSAVLPMVRIQTSDKDKPEAALNISGSAIFKKKRMIGRFNESQTTGLMLLLNKYELTSFTAPIENEDGLISFLSSKERANITPYYINGEWNMEVRIRVEGYIIQNGTKLLISDQKVAKSIEVALGHKIQRDVESTIEQAQRYSDVVGFAEAVHKKYPKQWNKMKNDWDRLFPRVKVKVKTEVNVLRMGRSSGQGVLQESDVKKK